MSRALFRFHKRGPISSCFLPTSSSSSLSSSSSNTSFLINTQSSSMMSFLSAIDGPVLSCLPSSALSVSLSDAIDDESSLLSAVNKNMDDYDDNANVIMDESLDDSDDDLSSSCDKEEEEEEAPHHSYYDDDSSSTSTRDNNFSPFPTTRGGVFLLPAFSLPFSFCRPFHTDGTVDESQENRQNASKQFRFEAGSHMIPHPSKVHKGGEDALFVSNDGCAIGVADGVGGWGEIGVDPGLYSKQFMLGSSHAVNHLNMTDPVDILTYGYESASHLQGSTTALVIIISQDGTELRSANVGDSGFLIIRNNTIIFHTQEQQHQFNFPYQLGTGSQDRPSHAERASVPLHEGDYIIAGTDGLFDNVDDWEILAIVAEGRDAGWDTSKIAKAIADRARECAAQTTGLVPFGKRAMQHGFLFHGGKMDDITVVAARVVTAASSTSSSTPSTTSASTTGSTTQSS